MSESNRVNEFVKNLSTRLRHRMWWIDVVWPLLLAGSMISALTHIIYSGQTQMRLANLAEDALLEFSLVQSGGWTAHDPGRVLIVNVTDEDKQTLGKISAPGGVDVRLDRYAELVRKLAEMGVSEIYLRLAPDIHNIYGPDFLPLLEAAAGLPRETQLHLGYSYRERKNLLEIVGQKIHVVDEDVCREGPFLQSRCSFNPDWNYWVIQNIYATSAHHSGRDGNPARSPSWVGTSFASRYPSFIMNLPDPKSITTASMSEVLQGAFKPKKPPLMVFIGSAIPTEDTTAAKANGVVQTPYDVLAGKEAATPLHVFWAQLGEMFLSGKVVHIPPVWLITVVSAIFCLSIACMLFYFPGPMALGSFVIYAATGPLINAISMKHFSFYMPLFESFYFGLTTLVIAGFGQLSVSALQKWRSDEKRKVHARTSDVKGNFISLLSHNLNTPIAKMQGTLSLLTSLPAQGDWKGDVRAAESHVAQLELAVRAVLTATAIEEGAVNSSPVTIKSLAEDFHATSNGPLKRLGIQLLTGEPRGHADYLTLPLRFDVKTIGVGLSSLTALFADPDASQTTIQVNFEVTDALQGILPELDREGPFLVCTIDSEQRWINGNAVAILRSDSRSSVRTRVGGDFLTDVLAGIGIETVRRFAGVVDLTPRGKGGRILLILRPETR